ncbi:hypothetical protein [Bathycoccus sp. RCC716 virus 3]|nr:hypothetical protein [Bathycoccus sp. RCC716 virus 3]
MKVHTLDIDSGERDPVLYPNPADYVVSLKSPIYNVTKISMISARIHNSQYLIHESNNTFTLNSGGSDYEISIPNGNYDGTDLASNVVVNSSSKIQSSVFNKDTNAITFTANNPFTLKFYTGTNGYSKTDVTGKTTPHDILGLPANDVQSTQSPPYTLETGSINLQGADGIIVKLSSGSDEFNKTIFSETPFYTGRILMCGDVINYSGVDDAVEHNFDSGSQKTISSLRVQFYYSSNNRLIPYDFRNANHILKLAVTCSTDKFVNIPRYRRDETLPTPMEIPREFEDVHSWDSFIPIFMVIATGLFLLVIIKKPSSKFIE